MDFNPLIILGVEEIRGKFEFNGFLKPFALWISFCTVAGFSSTAWLLHQLKDIAHQGWFRLNLIIVILLAVAGFGFGADYSNFNLNTFVDSLVFSAVFMSAYTAAVHSGRWVVTGFNNSKNKTLE